jgi:hypothetical protein
MNTYTGPSWTTIMPSASNQDIALGLLLGGLCASFILAATAYGALALHTWLRQRSQKG